MKFALIGQDIPTLLPTLLTDLLFAGHEAAQLAVQENNPAMCDVLRAYTEAIIARSGLDARVLVSGERDEVLSHADCVIYAGDCMPASRFRMDREALSGSDENDPGLTEQARVNGGLGGLMHTLRAADPVLDLCDDMDRLCPGALVICMGQPVARLTEVIANRGYRCYGLGPSPLRGPNGLDVLCKKMSRKPESIRAAIAGLPGFAFLLSIEDSRTGEDLYPQLIDRAMHGELGRLTARWYDWYGALAVGDVTNHAEFLPAQDDYIPAEEPQFGETVEQRKERILHMNTVGREGASSQAGAIAQVTLLSRANPLRPVQLALAVLRGEDLEMTAVTRRNHGEIAGLPKNVMIESLLTLRQGEEVPHALSLPGSLQEICGEVAETNHLAALAAAGDRSALRECVELDPALEGFDRLYCQEVTDRLIELHADVIRRL